MKLQHLSATARCAVVAGIFRQYLERFRLLSIVFIGCETLSRLSLACSLLLVLRLCLALVQNVIMISTWFLRTRIVNSLNFLP